MSSLKSAGVRKIVKKGGSLTVTIPPDAVDFLGIRAGEDLAFIGDVLGNVYMVRQQTLVDAYCSLKKK
jgi:antitoxin component of MazEF toxin-antitoxin module